MRVDPHESRLKAGSVTLAKYMACLTFGWTCAMAPDSGVGAAFVQIKRKGKSNAMLQNLTMSSYVKQCRYRLGGVNLDREQRQSGSSMRCSRYGQIGGHWFDRLGDRLIVGVLACRKLESTRNGSGYTGQQCK